MEVRSGGGDRYAAGSYPGPSSGVVHGGSSIELLVVCRIECGLFKYCLTWVIIVGVAAGMADRVVSR